MPFLRHSLRSSSRARTVGLFCTAAIAVCVLPCSAAAAGVLHRACVGAGGYIRVADRCRQGQAAVGLKLVPLAAVAKVHPAAAVIRPHTITGAQVKKGSLPGNDIKRGTLSAAALSSASIGPGLSLSRDVLRVNPLLLSPFQKRVSGSCPAGHAISTVNGDGTVACAATSGTGTVTSLSQGSGILLTPNPIVAAGTISADFTQVQARLQASCAAGTVIGGVSQSGAVSCVELAAGGEVSSGGSLLRSTTGISVTKPSGSTGVYCLTTPPDAGQAMTATTVYGGAFAIPEVVRFGAACPAGAAWEVVILNASNVQTDAAFDFTIVGQ